MGRQKGSTDAKLMGTKDLKHGLYEPARRELGRAVQLGLSPGRTSEITRQLSKHLPGLDPDQ